VGEVVAWSAVITASVSGILSPPGYRSVPSTEPLLLPGADPGEVLIRVTHSGNAYARWSGANLHESCL
jgi:hypothetical protein